MIKKRKILSLGYREMPVDMQHIIMSATLPDSAFEDKNPKPFTIKIDPKDEHRNSIKTLYGGLFEEVYAKKEIEPYGHFTFNTATNTISAFDVHNSNDFIIDPVAFAYDFGARMYDPRLGIFISADPHESRYPMWSPYSAMAGNPILFIDPDGRDIRIAGTVEFQTKTLAALQKLTNDKLVLKNGVLMITKLGGENSDKNFKEGTALVRELNKKGECAKVVTISYDKTNVTFAVDNPDDAKIIDGKNGKGSNSDVYFNPDDTEGGIDVKGGKERPPHIGLGHELIHAESNAKGTTDKTIEKNITDPDTGKKGTLTRDEIKTRGKENELRREQGVTERVTPE